MEPTETLLERLDQLHGKAKYFIAAMGIVGLLLVGASIMAWQTSREQQRLAQAHRQTMKILTAAANVRVGALDMLRGERGYLLTRDSDHLRSYNRGRVMLASGMEALRRQNRTPDERAQMAELELAADTYRREVDIIVSLARAGNGAQARVLVERRGGRDGVAPVASRIERVIADQRTRLLGLTRHVERSTTALLRFVYLTSATGLLLLLLATMAGLALRRSYARERVYRADLRKRAETDALTGVANRGELLRYLDQRIAEARRTGAPLSFAMFDIDNFKRVNDSYGHGVGDEAIRYVVRTAQKVVRINDRIGRLGGEEFGIVLPKSGKENSVQVCERLRQRLHAQGFPVAGQKLQVTISSGIACLTDEDDATSLVKRADEALYEAKRCGRDRVKLAA